MPPAVTENEDMLYLRVTWRTQEERFNVTHPKFKTKKMSVLPTPKKKKKRQNIVVFFFKIGNGKATIFKLCFPMRMRFVHTYFFILRL